MTSPTDNRSQAVEQVRRVFTLSLNGLTGEQQKIMGDAYDGLSFLADDLSLLAAALEQIDDLLRRLSEWDMLSTKHLGVPATADGPYWLREIANGRAALARCRAGADGGTA